MLTRNRINSKKDSFFEFCWNIYEESFPKEEKRSLSYHIETLKKEIFHFDAILSNGKPIGILCWWELDNFRYCEHFAILTTERAKGYGKIALSNFIQEDTKPIIIEVEHPTDDICRRRIAFYERLGFQLNPHKYAQPSYHHKDDNFVDLLIMTYPNLIEKELLDNFVSLCLPIIHFHLRR